ncbi:hypothetical protein CR513_53042, partial [Mucuna pruriens]
MVVTYKDWHEIFPYVLHEYHTSVRTFVGATPYSLIYGTEAVLSIEVEIPSLRVLAEVELEETKWIQQRLDQLNLIEEKRIKNTFDKKTRPCVFKKGDIALKEILPNAPNYEGSYVVKHAFSEGALIPTDTEGRDLKHPINADSAKMFFP